MNIHRYIYTRLTKDLSPTGKNGFQSAFLPSDLLASKDALEIESHIHFPEGLQIPQQSVVFYKQLKGQWYLVLLLLNPLPEVKDEHGRGGAFMCQGFLIAEADWRPMWCISDLKSLLAPHLFDTLDDLLNSPAVNRSTGRIADLEIDLAPDHWQRQLQYVEEEPEEQLLMAMYHAAKLQDRDLAVVVEGLPAIVSHRLEICAIYMPEVLRPRVAWDDAFDGGKIYFSPLRIFGYSELPPTTGRPVIFPADGSPAKWPEPELSRQGQPSDPFSLWLLEVCVKPVPRPRLDAMFALSEALVSGRPVSSTMETDPVFELVNRKTIMQVFTQGIRLYLDERWADKLAEITTSSQQLQMWMSSYQMGELTHLLEVSIIDQNLCPEVIGEAPPANLVRQGSPALQALATMWSREALDEAILAEIPEDNVAEVLTIHLARGAHEDLYLNPMLAFFRSYLHRLARDPKIANNLRTYLAAKVPNEYEVFKPGMAHVAVQMGEYGPLQNESLDWLRMLDRWLVDSGGNPEVWKAAKQLGKSTPLDSYPNLKVFAHGETRFTRDLEVNGPGRDGLLRCLVEVHGVKEEKLVQMGYFSTEVREIGSKSGFFGKIKRLFGG